VSAVPGAAQHTILLGESADVKRIALAAALVTLFVTPAFALKDKDAREQILALESRLNQVESSLQVRQMGLGEQIQSVREEIARIDSLIGENHRNTQLLANQLEVAKIEMQEALVQLNSDYGKRFKVVDENVTRLLKGIESLQQNVRTLSDNIQAMSEFEKKQEERINQLHAQLLQQINVVVDEVSRENLRLQGEITGMGRDIAAFQGLINKVDGKVRSLDGQLREVARRQESLARAASPSTASSGEGYVVRGGDTLSKIAAQFGITVEALMSHNNLTDDLIREGQTLAIPAP
jgi:archaellum component FlaC